MKAALTWLLISSVFSSAEIAKIIPLGTPPLPSFDVAVAGKHFSDIDGDGDLDIVLIPNDFSAFTGPGFLPRRDHTLWLENLAPEKRFAPPQLLAARPLILDLPYSFGSVNRFSARTFTAVDSNSSALLQTSFLRADNRSAFQTRSQLHFYDGLSFEISHLGDVIDVTSAQALIPEQIAFFELDAPLDGVEQMLAVYTFNHSCQKREKVAQVALASQTDSLDRLVVRDFDGDGDEDIIINGDIYLQSGYLDFTHASTAFAPSLLCLDINGDGRLDSIDTSGQTSAAIQQEDGSFSSLSLPSELQSGDEVRIEFIYELADSQAIAFAVRSEESGSVSLLQSTLTAPIVQSTHDLSVPNGLAGNLSLQRATLSQVEDFDGDGQLDILLNYETAKKFQSPFSALAIAYGKPNGFETPIWINALPGSTKPIVYRDLDSDGIAETLLFAQHDQSFYLLTENAEGRRDLRQLNLSVPHVPDEAVLEPYATEVADFNNDGRFDLLLTYSRRAGFTSFSSYAIAFHGEELTFATEHPPIQQFNDSSVFDLNPQLIDWDRDGFPDVVTENGWHKNQNGLHLREIRLLPNDLTPECDPNIITSTCIPTGGFGSSWTSFHLSRYGDIDGDGFIDKISPLVQTEPPTPGQFSRPLELGVTFGAGDAEVDAPHTFSLSLATTDAFGNPDLLPFVAVLDFDRDGDLDIAHVDTSFKLDVDAFGNTRLENVKYLWRVNPGGGDRDISSWSSAALPIPVFRSLTEIADRDGDGFEELITTIGAIHSSPLGPIFVANLGMPGRLNAEKSPVLKSEVDIDGDGDLEQCVVDPYGTITVFRNETVDHASPLTAYFQGLGLKGRNSTPIGDPDSDGRSNLVELLEESDPQISDVGSAHLSAVIVDPTSRELCFSTNNRLGEAGTLTYAIEHSVDLTNWSEHSLITSFPTESHTERRISVAGEGYYRINYEADTIASP